MPKIYIYTVRRARLNKKPQYVGLIPKLFDSLYANPEVDVPNFLNDLYSIYPNDPASFFLELLREQTNLLHNNHGYINKDDIGRIMKLNLDRFAEEGVRSFDCFI